MIAPLEGKRAAPARATHDTEARTTNDSTPRALGESLRDAAQAVREARRELVAHGVTVKLYERLMGAQSALRIASWLIEYVIAERSAA